MLAMGDSLDICHVKLKDMMEQPGGFEWSLMHNSPFELSKTVLMNFPRSYRDPIPSDLQLDKPNEDDMVTSSLTKPVASYKYLGVIFNSRLCWTLHQAKVLTTATCWASQIWWLLKSASDLSASDIKQLYNTVAVPGFKYGVEVWYTYLHRPKGANKTKGSVDVLVMPMMPEINKINTAILAD